MVNLIRSVVGVVQLANAGDVQGALVALRRIHVEASGENVLALTEELYRLIERLPATSFP